MQVSTNKTDFSPKWIPCCGLNISFKRLWIWYNNLPDTIDKQFEQFELPFWYKNNLYTEWYTILIRSDFPQPPSPERNKRNSTGTCFPYADLEMIYVQLYTKSNTCLCFKLSDLIFWPKSVSVRTVVLWFDVAAYPEKACGVSKLWTSSLYNLRQYFRFKVIHC